jgi:hypothetical protein
MLMPSSRMMLWLALVWKYDSSFTADAVALYVFLASLSPASPRLAISAEFQLM